MAKDIVILLDGTSNQIANDRSNILRLYGTLHKDAQQVVYYDPGVGTFGTQGRLSSLKSRTMEVWGMATGWGLDANVLEAYRFLVENFRRGGKQADGTRAPDDRIHLFGFSRGGYTAQVLAGFLKVMGLLEPRNLNLLHYAYRAYKRIGEHADKDDDFAEVRLYQRILQPYYPMVRTLGLFDAVSSVIESGRFGPQIRSHAYTRSNPSVESVFHAVSIDERRRMYHPALWREGGKFWNGPHEGPQARPQQVEQVWFAGFHADIGGSHSEASSGLAKLPLLWMIGKARQAGLRFRDGTVENLVLGRGQDSKYAPADPLGPAHDSMHPAWAVLQALPRRRPHHQRQGRSLLNGWYLPLGERRLIPPGATLHRSVLVRRDRLGLWNPAIPADHTVTDDGMPPA